MSVWTFWCSFVFLILLLLVFPLLLIGLNIPHPKVYRFMHFLPVYFAHIALFFMRIKVEVHHQERIDKNEQYLFVANHRSYLDALISAVANDNYKKYIGKAEILKYPVVGYLLKKLYVPVQRDKKDSRKWSMGKMNEYLESGASIVIFPEGTCNTTTELLKEFKDGAFVLSKQLNIPIAVYTIVGAAELMPRKLLSIRPGKIHVYWNKVLYPTNYVDTEKMKTESKQLIIKSLQANYPNAYR